MTTAQEIGEMFEEVVEHLDEFEYPYCWINQRQTAPNCDVDNELPRKVACCAP